MGQGMPEAPPQRVNARTPQASTARALIIGCGYLGAVTARMLAAAGQREVWATTRTRDRWEALGTGCTRLLQYDISRAGAENILPRDFDAGSSDVFVMLTPSAIGPALADGGYSRLLEAIVTMNPRRAVLVSSTGVYGEQDGGIVTAETPPQPPGTRGKQLLDIENRWLGAGAQHRVCRLAGIYGPGRVVGRESLLNGAVLPGDPGAWLNLIHVEDAAELVIRCARADNAHAIELGSDGDPVSRKTYYTWLASLLGAAPPQFDPAQRARSGSKRCDPRATQQRLGWTPKYCDFRAGLAASLNANDPDA